MKASIIIPTYNRPDYITKTVGMALRQTDIDFEVIVVDQTTSCGTHELEKLCRTEVKLIYLHSDTPNASTARNAALEIAKGDVILFIDDDVEFDETLLGKHVRVHEQLANAGAVLGLIIPEHWENRNDELRSGPGKYECLTSADSNGRYSIKWAPSGNTSYKRLALDRVGGFDPLLKAYCEDADLSVRVRSAGFDLVYDPSIELLHLAAVSGGCDNRNPTMTFTKEAERVWASLYFVFKNRLTIGSGPVIKTTLRNFRQFVISRNIISSGPLSVVKRGYSFVSIFLSVIGQTIRVSHPS